MIKGILFDKDGTLLEFERTWHLIMKDFFARIKKRAGLREEEVEKMKAYSGYMEKGFQKESRLQYMPMQELFCAWKQLLSFEDDFIDKADEVYRQVSLHSETLMMALPKVQETLNYLYNKGYILGVATSDQEESTRHGLKKVGIDSYFSYFGCDTIGKPGKPNPQMAYDFCELYHLRTEEILIVGDSLSDAEFAKNAEATFVGIQNEYGCFADVTDNNSVKLIHQMDELIKLFGL